MTIRKKTDTTPKLRIETDKPGINPPAIYKNGYVRTRLAPRPVEAASNTKYDPVYYPYWTRKLSLLGLSKRQIAKVFNITEKTFRSWCDNIKELREAFEDGNFKADSMVASALFERAIGFSVPEEKLIVIGGTIVREEVNKYYPPSVEAAEKWLARRGGSSGLWSGRGAGRPNGEEGNVVNNNTQINISNFGIQNLSNIELGDFSDAELEVLISAGIKYRSIEEMRRVNPKEEMEDVPYRLTMDAAPLGRVDESPEEEVNPYDDNEEDEEWGDE